MNEFPPGRQRGLWIHIALTILVGLASIFSLWLTFQTRVGPAFSLYLLLFIITAIPVPILGYRAYALSRANYLLDRNTLRLIWGLRIEDIPVNNVEWVRPANNMPGNLHLPLLRLPGGILGITHQRDIGKVEFLASEADRIILVATPGQVYAISPENSSAFLSAFQKAIEMGSLQSVHGISQHPSFVVVNAWESMPVRIIWLAGIFLNTGLLIWVTLLIPSLEKISLGFLSDGSPRLPVPGTQLVLLPLLSIFLFIFGLIAGLFFYRRSDLHIPAIIVWISGACCALLFILAVFFIIRTPL